MQTTVPAVFDRLSLCRHQDRAAYAFSDFDFLFRDVAARLSERLDDITRIFPVAVDLGSHGGILAPYLHRRSGTQHVLSTDYSYEMSQRARQSLASSVSCSSDMFVQCDEEALPFAEGCLDLVTSSLALHWVNDLPGTFVQVRRILKPDGLFLGALFGGETLCELKESFLRAESEVEGGVSPRVSPFVDVRDVGMLLQRAGFALPVVDSDTIPVTYSSPLKLMADLRGMGESNVLTKRRLTFSRRQTLLRASEIYTQNFSDKNGSVRATFQVVWFLGWVPAETQPQALKPGSATHSLADALGAKVFGVGSEYSDDNE